MGFSRGSAVKNQPANAGDTGLIPGSGRSPGEGKDNPLQDSCLGTPIDRGAWQATVHSVTRSQTRLNDRQQQYVYVWLIHFAAQQKLTVMQLHCKKINLKEYSV